jgi:hypothetical protein
MMDVTNQVFIHIGVGYQNGLQTISVDGTDYWHGGSVLAHGPRRWLEVLYL